MKRFFTALVTMIAGTGASASVFLNNPSDIKSYFYHNPVAVGESSTVSFEIDYCAGKLVQYPDLIGCDLLLVRFPSENDFWTFSYDGSYGPSALEQVYRFSLTFHPQYYIDGYSWDYFKLIPDLRIQLAWNTPLFGNDADYRFDPEGLVIPEIPLPATMPLLLLGLAGIRSAARRPSWSSPKSRSVRSSMEPIT